MMGIGKVIGPLFGGAIGPLFTKQAPVKQVPATGVQAPAVAPAGSGIMAPAGPGIMDIITGLIGPLAQVGTGVYAIQAASKVERVEARTRSLQAQLATQQQAQLISQLTKLGIVVVIGYTLYRIFGR